MHFTDEQILNAFPRTPWPHQFRGVKELLHKLETLDSVVMCSPTGGGKGVMQSAILNLLASISAGAIIYNSRRTLTGQSYKRLMEDNIHCGVRAASMKDQQNLDARFQVGSIQTDIQRVLNQKVWNIHKCEMALIDEAHLSMGGKVVELFQLYLGNKTKLVGVTGTPVGMSGLYKDIVVAGTNSELRACGAHVPARIFSVHEMDTSKIKVIKTGEYRDGDIQKHCWSQAIVGHIYNDYKRLNPDGRPAMSAASGIGESVWLSEEFLNRGHKVVHIDCEEVIINGERYKNDPEGKVREQALDEFRAGKFDIICNCEVIQQGVDITNLYHLILARPYGSLANFLQTCGRVLRRSDETPDHVIIQDHGANVFRHGSPNEDRDWAKLFDMTEGEIALEQQKKKEDPKTKEPITCAGCGMVRREGARCPGCGHISDKTKRVIVQQDGQLIEMTGRIYKKPADKPVVSREQKVWDNIYFPSSKSKSPNARNFNQLAGEFKRQTGSNPPNWLKRIPKDPKDFCRKARDVSWEELT